MNESRSPDQQAIQDEKRRQRTLMRQRFCTLPPELLIQQSAAATQRLLNLPEFQQAKTLMAFISLKDEISTRVLIEAAWNQHKELTVPRVLWEQSQIVPLVLRHWKEPMTPDRMGLLYPAAQEIAAIETLDLVVVPGLAFDPKGGRLGRGKGFYDRFLQDKHFRGIACGFALEMQVCEKIPLLPHDKKLDMLVTEAAVRRFI